MEVAGHFIDYLLNHGEFAAAVLVALSTLAGGAIWRWRRGSAAESGGLTASSTAGGQTTQVANVRTKGDVTVAPTQRHG